MKMSPLMNYFVGNTAAARGVEQADFRVLMFLKTDGSSSLVGSGLT